MALIEVYGGLRSFAFELTYSAILRIFIIQLFPNCTACSPVTFNNYPTSVHWIWLGYNHLISNKRKWNNGSIKNAHKISRILPDFIC